MEHDVMALDQLAVGQQQCLQVATRRILLCRTDIGIYAIENRCPHAGLPLQGGAVEGDAIRCPSHGAKFHLADGSHITGKLKAVTTYPVSVVEGRIILSL